LSYLEAQTWEARVNDKVANAVGVTRTDAMDPSVLKAHRDTGVKVFYTNARSYESLATALGAMANIKAGVPRSAYHGVVSFERQGTAVHLVPRGGPSTAEIR
jgi:alpha-1,3-mannosyl-glycoprotein beta-1,2-N-acetylglucosaminyltransferase